MSYFPYEKVLPLIGVISTWNQQKIDDTELNSLEKSYAAFKIALDYLSYVMGKQKTTYYHEIIVVSIRVACQLGSLCNMTLSEKRQRNVFTDKINASWEQLFQSVKVWMIQVLPPKIYSYTLNDKNELIIYDALFGIVINDEEIQKSWCKMLTGRIETRLQNISVEDKIELFCRCDFTGKDPKIEGCFSQVAFDALEEAAKNKDKAFTCLFETKYKSKKLGDMMSALFLKALPKYNDVNSNEVLFNHMLDWPTFPPYLQFFSGKEKHAQILNEDAQIKMTECISIFETTIDKIKQNGISLQKLEKILKKRKEFMGIYKSQCDDSSFDMRTHLDNLEKDLKEFKKLKAHIGVFLTMCDTQIVLTKELAVKHKQVLSVMKISEIWTRSDDGTLNAIYFNIPAQLYKVLPHMDEYRNSHTFMGDIWKRKCKQLHKKKQLQSVALDGSTPITVDDVVNEAWPEAVKELLELLTKLRDGTITFSEVDKYFESYKDKYSELETEFKAIEAVCEGERKRWITERRQQIERYFTLDQYKQGAKVIIDLKDKLDLAGDFSVLTILIEAGENKLSCISEINQDVMEAGRAVQGINAEKIACIKTMVNCMDLVDWLRENVKGTKEVKVLADLAMISAVGQGDKEVEKASCLLAATTGYGPLIFELTPESGFKEFIHKCELVWKVLEKEPYLPAKLKDTRTYLDWLKNINESHGSVEVNALEQATAINNRGIFKVGNIRKATINENLDEVIELIVQPEDNTDDSPQHGRVKQKEKLVYNLQQLTDLQSKLVLVAGKAEQGKDAVDRFSEIYDSVTRIGTEYLKLCAAGNILFNDFMLIFYCDENRKFNAEVDFGIEDMPPLRDESEGSCSLSEQLKGISNFLGHCLEEWHNEINKHREKFYYLNHFTTEQLVILRRGLAQIYNHDNIVSLKDLNPMLHTIRENCSEKELNRALDEGFREIPVEAESVEDDESGLGELRHLDKDEMNDSFGEIKPIDAETEDQDNNNKENDQLDPYADTEKYGSLDESCNDDTPRFTQEDLDEFYEALAGSDVTKSHATRALKAVGCDIQQAIFWCIENPDDGENEEENGEKDTSESNETEHEAEKVPNQDPGSQEVASQAGDLHLFRVKKTTTLKDMTKALLEEHGESESLEEGLQTMWDEFRKVSGHNISDYLSIQHVGHFLDKLAGLETARTDRPFPTNFAKGKPNLIVCPQGEMYQRLVSIFMYNKGMDQSPPRTDEVLLCTPSTSKEEVTLLWRRATGSKKGDKIFCLVNADLLDYSVANYSLQTFEKITGGMHDYKIIVMCSQEREDKALYVSAHDRHRVTTFNSRTPTDITHYIHKNLQVVGDNVNGCKPMACLDPERCSARMIKSDRAGCGKTLRKNRLCEEMRTIYKTGDAKDFTIPLQTRIVNKSETLKILRNLLQDINDVTPILFHINVAHEVESGLDDLLFNLLILGSLTDKAGYVWRKRPIDFYVIETMPLLQQEVKTHMQKKQGLQYVHHILPLLPSLHCWSPVESVSILEGKQDMDFIEEYRKHDQLFDDKEYRGEAVQRPYQYLQAYTAGGKIEYKKGSVAGTPLDCLHTLLRHCGLKDPSWSELRHFVWFLNTQLSDSETSIFCSPMFKEDLPGFTTFVVKFMIQMSKDFATRSLDISEETPGFIPKEKMLEMYQRQVVREDNDAADGNGEGLIYANLNRFQLKRKWETSPHPYIFFNQDRQSMTFLGFNIDRKTRNLIDNNSGAILEHSIMSEPLNQSLYKHGVPLSEDFDKLARMEKIKKLCLVMGRVTPSGEVEIAYDDDSYELTTDNVKKILAIYMRFRCEIPVMIMGETGCGKTRLIEYMCNLQKPVGVETNNMIILKVHGGTTEQDIIDKVEEAIRVTRYNKTNYNLDTVLFFDEANTTEAIGLIKEIMCDRKINGRPLVGAEGLKLVAACNPYRRHTDAMIKKLEQAGLGYHIAADETTDKLGRVPMRRLVYRVQALPQSMLPLVWDFGQLNTETELLYIKQIVNKYVEGGGLNLDAETPELRAAIQDIISRVLAASQQFMRDQKDECSFVSLRDIDRVLRVMSWFYGHRELLFEKINEIREREENILAGDRVEADGDEGEGDDAQHRYTPPDDRTRSLILAIAVCYHPCLQSEQHRSKYRKKISRFFKTAPCSVPHPVHENIYKEITHCQEVFLDEVTLGPNIAKNQALRENVFMMVVCIELRIPLFLVGKPGSSKSLARTIVADAMQGNAAKSELYKSFKLVTMLSFQCSPLSTPDGIIGTFQQCAKLQMDKDHDEFVSVVVLDEVGLAEDSPTMPLKTLHPLLEEGACDDKGNLQKVGFIGISNWALDPAKMNRGILVQRCVPDDEELNESAMGICSTDAHVRTHIETFLRPLAEGYLELYESALDIREFFGLRDFYSLIKMVYSFAAKSKRPPTWPQLLHAIKRNFGGLRTKDPVEVFEKKIHIEKEEHSDNDPDSSPAGLIKASLKGDSLDLKSGQESPSRYLLLLTENNAALTILDQHLLDMQNTKIIYGSSFPKDQEYTQVCRNINRIKMYMATGKTVVLINTDNLYESLYDVLNQYYETLGGSLLVDLGLGSHRVKCKVDRAFRLIVVAEQDHVYKQFPIPLINRLEKHFLAMSTILDRAQTRAVEELEMWAQAFVNVPMFHHAGVRTTLKKGDIFIGYHRDAAASVILQLSNTYDIQLDYLQITAEAKKLFLRCATPESVLRLKHKDAQNDMKTYFEEQKHTSLHQFILDEIRNAQGAPVFAQVTTHSKLLSKTDVRELCDTIRFKPHNVLEVGLQKFDTEQEFCKELSEFFNVVTPDDRLLILQCVSGDQYADLIACSRHYIINEYEQAMENKLKKTGEDVRMGRIHVVFVIQLPRIAGGCFIGFQGGRWSTFYLDDLRPSHEDCPNIDGLHGHAISSLFEAALGANPAQPIAEDAGMDLERRIEDMAVDDTLIEEQNETSEVNTMEIEEIEEGEKEESIDTEQIEMEIEDGEKEGDKNEENELSPEDEILRQLEAIDPESVDPLAEDTGDVSSSDKNGAKIPTTGPQMTVEDKTVTNMDDEIMEPQQNVPKLNVLQIILNCMHAAGSMVKDHASLDKDRKVERVEKIYKIVQKDLQADTADLKLSEVLLKRLVKLLKEKETVSRDPDNWVSNEVAAIEAVNKAGTLRRALDQCIENKITIVLAGLMAFIDPDKNVDLLSADQWLQQLWLTMLSKPEVTPFHYDEIRTAVKQSELTEFRVLTHGYGQNNFVTRFPFSWIVKDTLDHLMHKCKAVEDTESTMKSTFEASPMGKVLNDCIPEDQKVRAVEMFLQDYIRMIYRPASKKAELQEHEYLMVVRAIVISAHQHHNEVATQASFEVVEEPEVTPQYYPSFVDIHQAYHRIEKRLQNFSMIIEAVPEMVESLWKFSTEVQHELNEAKEMTLDIKALNCLLESFRPGNKELDDVKPRNSWMEKIQRCQPLVSRTIAAIEADILGPVAEKHLQLIKGLWSVAAVVYLFVEHVGTPKPVLNKKLNYNVFNLWKILDPNDQPLNFKEDKTQIKLERYLKSCNVNIGIQIFGKMGKCQRCKEGMVFPVKLPCGHIMCQKCVKEELDVKQKVLCTEKDCKKVHKVKDVSTQPIQDKKQCSEAMLQYKQNCNSFFMQFVSQHCFEGSTPPERKVIERFLNYVTKKSTGQEVVTKQFGINDDAIDPTPVVRFFLLQLLLRSNSNDVQEYLEQYFKQVQDLARDPQHTLQLIQLIVQCFEDSYEAQFLTCPSTTRYIRGQLYQARNHLLSLVLTIDKVSAIAQARHALAVVAEWLYVAYIDPTTQGVAKNHALVQELEGVFAEAKGLCENNEQCEWPRKFLVKMICRRYGMETLKSLAHVNELLWVVPLDMARSLRDVNTDRFVLYGDTYKELRGEIMQYLASGKIDAFKEKIQNFPPDMRGKHERSLILALCREVTFSNGQEQPELRVSQEKIAELTTMIQEHPNVACKILAEKVLTNRQGNPGNHRMMTIVPGMNNLDLSIFELVIHFQTVFTTIPPVPILGPLLSFVRNPAQMQGKYLPTMPQDPLDDVRKAFQGTAGENPTLWQCPNGHPYMIGNCGRPVTAATCKACGAPIGGTNYVSAAGNVHAQTGDTTMKGHALGRALNRSRALVSERNLSPVKVVILRLLTHLSMVTGANQNINDIVNLMQPPVPLEELSVELWTHIKVDIEMLSAALGKSQDDCFLVIHKILIDLCSADLGHVNGDFSLQSKDSRMAWETTFAKVVLERILQNIEDGLKEANNAIASDDRVGHSMLLRLVHELDDDIQNTSIQTIQNSPIVWKHRTKISVADFQRKLEEDAANLDTQYRGSPDKLAAVQILIRFMQKSHHLSLLRLIPDIERLQLLLSQRYYGNIEKSEATHMKIEEFLNKLPQDHTVEEHKALLESFYEAWDCVRSSLKDFAIGGGLKVPTDYCDKPITEKSSLAYLLPTVRGEGLCALGLLAFLCRLQNDFVEEYATMRKKTCDTYINLKDTTRAHVVGFDTDRDILPIILANCNYSFSVKDNKASFEYDYITVSKQIEERFLYGKPRIIFEPELMAFRTELTNASMFEQLNSRIPQEQLTHTVKQQIMKESRDLAELGDSLANLDIAIGFLVSIGPDPELLLMDFLRDTLKKNSTLCSVKAQQSCRLKHVKALWLLLSQRRAQILAQNGHEAFDTIDLKYKEPLTADQAKTLHNALRHVNMDVFIAELYQCIILQITVKQNQDDEDYFDNANYPLGIVLGEFTDAEIQILDDGTFPEDITASQCIETWCEAFRFSLRHDHI